MLFISLLLKCSPKILNQYDFKIPPELQRLEK